MTSTVPTLHFVRCPKCLKVLAEFPGASLYKCGGCGAILQGKTHSSSGETLSLASSASNSSKNISNNDSLRTETLSGKHIPYTSHHSGNQDQVVKICPEVSGSNGEISILDELSQNVVKHPTDIESNHLSLGEEKKSEIHEQNGLSFVEANQLDQGIPAKTEDNLNDKGKTKSDQEISKAGNSFRSSDELSESSRSGQHDTTSKDEVNEMIRKKTSFLLRSSSSRAYYGSASSPDKLTREHDLSFTSEDFHSARNFTGSGYGPTSRSQLNDTKEFAKLRYSQKTDQVKILRKVDELRNELRGLFNKAANGKGEAKFSKSKYLEARVSPNQSSPVIAPPHPESTCCCDHCPHNVRCHLFEGATSGLPLHMKHGSPLYQDLPTLTYNGKRSHEIKRHCRPVSGGAPFVICYKCYNLLQLPADFLVSTKRVHKLRCGSCFEVLQYSFRPKTRLTVQTPAEVPLPPTEDENSNEVLGNTITAQTFIGMREGEPYSYSEDYGPSFGKSESYEADHFRNIGRNYTAIVEEEIGGKKPSTSQLHRLMGYSSARQLLFETQSSVEGHRTEHDR